MHEGILKKQPLKRMGEMVIVHCVATSEEELLNVGSESICMTE